MFKDQTHDEYFPQSTRCIQADGFEYVYPNLIPGRRGERPDLFAVASRETPFTEWGDTEDGRPIPIKIGDSQVGEIKRLRSDFKADAEKYHRRKPPKYGNYFFYYCPEGLINPKEVHPERGLYWLLEDGSWKLMKPPMRRVIEDREHEYMLIAKALHELMRKQNNDEHVDAVLRETGSGKVLATVPVNRPKQKRIPSTLKPIADWLGDNPHARASEIKNQLRLKTSASKLAQQLIDAGFPNTREGGIDYFNSPSDPSNN